MSLSRRIVFLPLVAICCIALSCRTSAPECDLPFYRGLLSSVASWDWATTSSKIALTRFQDDAARYEYFSSVANEACGGINSLRRTDRVLSGVCECCLTLEFIKHDDGGKCHEQLEVVVIETTAATRQQVAWAIEVLYNDLSIPAAASTHATSEALYESGAEFQWIVEGTTYFVRSTARSRRTGGWLVRIHYGRFMELAGNRGVSK